MTDDAPDRPGWLEELPRAIGRLTPDAISAAAIMLLALGAAALLLGNPVETVMDAWYRGLWMLLPFTMQMTLVLVLSGVVGQTPHFRSLIHAPRHVAENRESGDCRSGPGQRGPLLRQLGARHGAGSHCRHLFRPRV